MGGKEIEYTIALPSTRLVGEEIEDLEQVLQNDGSNSSMNYKMIDGSTVYTFDSAVELLNDATVPDFVREFSISLECDSGILEINSNSEDAGDPIQLSINGAPKWARSKRAEVQDFFSTKKDKFRTFAEGGFRLELIVGAILTAVVYLLRWAGFAGDYGITTQGDINRVVFVGVAVTFLSEDLFNYFYPYTLLVLNPNKELFPFLQRLAYLLTLVAAIIAINSWLMS